MLEELKSQEQILETFSLLARIFENLANGSEIMGSLSRYLIKLFDVSLFGRLSLHEESAKFFCHCMTGGIEGCKISIVLYLFIMKILFEIFFFFFMKKFFCNLIIIKSNLSACCLPKGAKCLVFYSTCILMT